MAVAYIGNRHCSIWSPAYDIRLVQNCLVPLLSFLPSCLKKGFILPIQHETKKVTYLGLSNKISTRKWQHGCCPWNKHRSIRQVSAGVAKDSRVEHLPILLPHCTDWECCVATMPHRTRTPNGKSPRSLCLCNPDLSAAQSSRMFGFPPRLQAIAKIQGGKRQVSQFQRWAWSIVRDCSIFWF